MPLKGVSGSFDELEIILAETAVGACEVIGYIGPLGAGGDSVLGAARILVVDVSADALVFRHAHKSS